MDIFSWREKRGHGLPEGVYAADVVDQHEVGWCGACYLVAAVQMVEDRAHIARARRHGKFLPRIDVDMQTVLDHFREWDAEPGWNACHGGYPVHVLRCMQTGECPIILNTSKRQPRIVGFPQSRCHLPRGADFRLENPRRVPLSEVKRHIQKDGPVILEVSAQTLKTSDANGVVTDLTPRESNHAVSVVGWKDDMWIVRNSWGKRRVPKDVPKAYATCVREDHNSCVVEWISWKGDPRDPGFLYLPMSFEPLHGNSPWIVVDVSLVE